MWAREAWRAHLRWINNGHECGQDAQSLRTEITSFEHEQCFCGIQTVLWRFYEVLKLWSIRLLSDIWKPGILKSSEGAGGSEERKQWRGKNIKHHGRATSFQLKRICWGKNGNFLTVPWGLATWTASLEFKSFLTQSSLKPHRKWCVFIGTAMGGNLQEYFETLLFTPHCVNREPVN